MAVVRHHRAARLLADELAVLTGTGLLGALRTLGHTRFRPCASPVCDGVFVDTSRAGRRRYCMPDLCGNRINVAKHRARRQRADS
ncbi:CGNR zinc finger domain-containing protein [Streptomyces sp. M19]